MKKFVSIAAIAVLLLCTVGCSCGLSCCGSSQVPKAPENAAFTLAFDDAGTESILAYFQANTGYQPTYIDVTEPTDTAKDAAALAATACVAVVADEANAAALEAVGWTRVSLDTPFALTVLEAPSSSTAVRNTDAVSALKVWLGGTEAKYLFEHPDLLN